MTNEQTPAPGVRALSPRCQLLRRSLAIALAVVTMAATLATVQASPAAASSEQVNATCHSYTDTITISVDSNHVWVFIIQRWNGSEWVSIANTGANYLSSNFGEDSWGNQFTPGYYRIWGIVADVDYTNPHYSYPWDMDFWNDRTLSTDRYGNPAGWCRIR